MQPPHTPLKTTTNGYQATLTKEVITWKDNNPEACSLITVKRGRKTTITLAMMLDTHTPSSNQHGSVIWQCVGGPVELQYHQDITVHVLILLNQTRSIDKWARRSQWDTENQKVTRRRSAPIISWTPAKHKQPIGREAVFIY